MRRILAAALAASCLSAGSASALQVTESFSGPLFSAAFGDPSLAAGLDVSVTFDDDLSTGVVNPFAPFGLTLFFAGGSSTFSTTPGNAPVAGGVIAGSFIVFEDDAPLFLPPGLQGSDDLIGGPSVDLISIGSRLVLGPGSGPVEAPRVLEVGISYVGPSTLFAAGAEDAFDLSTLGDLATFGGLAVGVGGALDFRLFGAAPEFAAIYANDVAVPLPAAGWLLIGGLGLLAAARRRV
ncbi:MAG: VPLPA-CTERM sorting domain-containing protein [Pseudomonadota bacterium]